MKSAYDLAWTHIWQCVGTLTQIWSMIASSYPDSTFPGTAWCRYHSQGGGRQKCVRCCRIEVRFAHLPYRQNGPVQQLDRCLLTHIAIHAVGPEDELVFHAPRLPLNVSQARPYPISRPTITKDRVCCYFSATGDEAYGLIGLWRSLAISLDTHLTRHVKFQEVPDTAITRTAPFGSVRDYISF